MTKMFLFFARVPRGCDVALKATWQRHAGPRGAYATLCIYLIHTIYKWVFSLAYMGRGIRPFNLSGLINPTDSTNVFRVGLSLTQLFLFQATWLAEEHWIKIAMQTARRCGGHEVHPIFDQCMCYKSNLSEAL